MNKKVLMMMLCLITSLTLGYMYGKEYMLSFLNAQSAPAFTLPKGSKVVLGSYNGKEIVWDIGNNDNNGSYVLMSSVSLVPDGISIYDSRFPVTTVPQSGADIERYCLKHQSRAKLFYCPSTYLKDEINNITLSSNETFVITKNPFLPTITDIKNGGTLGLSLEDRAYKAGLGYWLDGRIKLWGNTSKQYFVVGQGNIGGASGYDLEDLSNNAFLSMSEEFSWLDATSDNGTPVKQSLRPFTLIDKNKITFAASTSYTDGSWHSYSIDTSNFNENNELNPNKLRIQSSLTASLQDIKRNNLRVQKVAKNQSVNLSVNANTGTNTKMSVILYNDAGTEIQYYRMMESTRSGTNDYTLDFTDVSVGKYQVAVINEEYDADSQLPLNSSPISDLMPLEIVEPHKITYTKTPQSGAAAGDYEFSKNVNAGQAVGKVTANPLGVTPLVYDLISNGDNSYQNFEIDGLDANNASSNTPLNVKIKSNAPDLINGGLKA